MKYSDYDRLPLVEALLTYESRGHVSMHVPGHKDGAAYYDAASGEVDRVRADVYRRYADLLRQDVTEVEGTDDLHQPTGPIREAQELAAAFFGAEATHFLVGGSTAGNVAALLTCCSKPGDIVLVQRNVHKSVIHGLKLAGARAVFLSPQMDRASGLLTAPSLETVEAGLAKYPQAKAVLLCSPNYYGLGVNIKDFAEAAHRYGVPLVIDEAHGAHYGLHPDLPCSALQSGADLVVQSTHKMLLGMTMSAMLHVQGTLIHRERLQRMLATVQSSSPSYPLMASLDMSRHWVQTRGEAAFTPGLAAVGFVREALADLAGFTAIPAPDKDQTACMSQDPFKLVLRDASGHRTGYDLLERLTELGVVAEMADIQYVVLLFTLATTKLDAERVIQALKTLNEEIGSHHSIEAGEHKMHDQTGDISTHFNKGRQSSCNMTPPELYEGVGDVSISEPVPFSIYEEDKPKQKVMLYESVGRRAAEAVIPYPPGIPLIYAGEQITEAHIIVIRQLADAGAKCQDVSDPQLKSLIVYKDKE